MWLATTRGFVSAVEWSRPGDPHDGMIVLRARERGHLEEVTALVRSRPEVFLSPKADYRYRAFVTRKEFEKLVVALAREVTYPNFKNAVLARQGHSRYETVLHRVWDAFAKLQPTGPYGWGGRAYPALPKGERPARGKKAPAAAAAERCAECGHVGDATDRGLNGEPLCADVGACVDRSRDLRRALRP